jgi:flavin reductase (DIM6/NTAB) family NADH-FMN oxidoreductase RutF/molybdenum-dependent DNA-binding transcriptional regulator ModE
VGWRDRIGNCDSRERLQPAALAGARRRRPFRLQTLAGSDTTAPPRAEQSQQRCHTLAGRPCVQRATVARMKIDGIAGPPTIDRDDPLTGHGSILLINPARADEPALDESWEMHEDWLVARVRPYSVHETQRPRPAMETLAGMRLLAEVVDSGSFSAAGRRLGMAASSAARGIGALENELGARLLNRTTRKLGLTEAGRLYHERSKRILVEIEDARLSVTQLETAPRHAAAQRPGRVRAFARRARARRLSRPASGAPDRPRHDRRVRRSGRGGRGPGDPDRRAAGFQPDRPPARAEPARHLREPRVSGAPWHADGAKDTTVNIRGTDEFVVNLVDEPIAEAMNLCAIDFPPEVSEVEAAGLELAPSQKITPPRIAQAPVHLECRRYVTLEPARERYLVIGEVLVVHLRDGLVDPATLRSTATATHRSAACSAAATCARRDPFDLPRLIYREWLAQQSGG